MLSKSLPTFYHGVCSRYCFYPHSCTCFYNSLLTQIRNAFKYPSIKRSEQDKKKSKIKFQSKAKIQTVEPPKPIFPFLSTPNLLPLSHLLPKPKKKDKTFRPRSLLRNGWLRGRKAQVRNLSDVACDPFNPMRAWNLISYVYAFGSGRRLFCLLELI